MIFTGLVALIARTDTAAPSPVSVANAVGAKMFLLCGAGVICLVGGGVALLRGIKTSRQRKRERMTTGIGRSIAVTLVTSTLLAGVVFASFKFMTRWSPEEAWAANVIGEAEKLQILLKWYYNVVLQ